MVILLPDGVEWEVPLEHMAVKDAIFIPTLNAPATKPILRRISRQLEMQIEMQTTIEDGYLGVMVWRTA